MGSFVNTLLTHAPDIIIQGIAVWWANLLGQEVWQVGCAEVLGHLGIVGGDAVLLEDIMVPSWATPSFEGFTTSGSTLTYSSRQFLTP